MHSLSKIAGIEEWVKDFDFSFISSFYRNRIFYKNIDSNGNPINSSHDLNSSGYSLRVVSVNKNSITYTDSLVGYETRYNTTLYDFTPLEFELITDEIFNYIENELTKDN